MLLANFLTLLRLGVFEDFMTHQGKPWGWADTLVLTFAGFFIVFLVLLILIIIFTVFGKVMQKANAKQAEKESAQPKPAAHVSDGEVDDETAAVIVAAITEASGGKNVIIKDIKEAKK